MIRNIVLLDIDDRDDLYPFSIMHPAWEIRCGCLKIYEKYFAMFPQRNIHFKSDDLILQSFLKRNEISKDIHTDEPTLFIYGNVLPKFSLFDEIESIIKNNSAESMLFESNNKIFAAYQKMPTDFDFYSIDRNKIETFAVKEDLVHQINYLWETLDYNSRYIPLDYLLIEENFDNVQPDMYPGCHCIRPDMIRIASNVKISPGVVLDASEGEIVIDEGAAVMHNAVIIGPVYIGKNSIIKVGAKIYPNCSFGQNCKIGGELEATIFQAYSNKQHEGFLGHSYISEWVNLGADTNNSDLKNTYSNIIMRTPTKRIPTEKMFIGLMCGDHSKSAINTQFTTGTTVGIHCNLFTSGFHANQIQSYTWGGAIGESKRYNFEAAIDTARIVMKRRNRELSEEEFLLMEKEFKRL